MSDEDRPDPVITPIFGQPGGARVYHPDFEGKDIVEYDIAGTQVTLVHRDLFTTGVEGFVIPQWENKVSDGGIAYAGMQVFGTDFNREYEKHIALDSNREKLARVVMVPDEKSGKHFFHTVTVQTGHLFAAQNVFDAVVSVLLLCEVYKKKSVGIPAMCTGRQGELLDEQSAKTIANAIYRWSQTKPSAVEITIAISGYDSFERFKAFKQVFDNPHFYQDFDPSQEVGQRPEDLRRTLIERAQEGKSGGVVVVDKSGQIIGGPQNGATVHDLFGKGPKV